MKILWDHDAWDDYLYWQQTDKAILRKINTLIKDIRRSPFSGIGHPEPLKLNLAGQWSRHIDREHRLVYVVKDDMLIVMQCRYHY